MTAQRIGAAVALVIFALWLFWSLRFGEVPAKGMSFSRDEHPALYWPLVGLLGFGVVASIAALLAVGL